MEDAQDGDYKFAGSLINLVGNGGPLLVSGHSHALANVVASAAGEWEDQDGVDVFEER